MCGPSQVTASLLALGCVLTGARSPVASTLEMSFEVRGSGKDDPRCSEQPGLWVRLSPVPSAVKLA